MFAGSPRVAPLTLLRHSRQTPFVTAATFDSLCSVSEAAPVSDAHAVLLDHHVCNEFCKAWEKQASDPQPFIDVTIQAVPSDTHSLGLHTSLNPPPPTRLPTQ